MPLERVICSRVLTADADDIWAVFSSFDLAWHPFVTTCQVGFDVEGALIRTFETADGGRLVEQRTYASDHDQTLRYTATSGIEGALAYHASVQVKAVDAGQCKVSWSAEITATAGLSSDIAEGTQAVFDAGLAELAREIPSRKSVEERPPPRSKISKGNVDHLTFRNGEAYRSGGTLVLFLHGIGGHANNWDAQIEVFGADYTVAAMNFRGYGGSALRENPTQIDDHCDDINALADRFGASRLVLVGLSMGAWIATSFAMRHGKKLAGLVLAGGCTGMSEASSQKRDAFFTSREAPLSQGKTPADFADAVVEVIAGPRASIEMRKLLHRSMSDIPVESYRDALKCFCTPSERFDFSNIQCPVLLMTGAYDRLAPPDEIREVSTRIYNAQVLRTGRADVSFEVVKNAGHVCNLESPDDFNAYLAQFLGRLPDLAVKYRPNRAQR